MPQTQPPRARPGRPDPNAIVNDALKRRLVSITVLYTLAAAYEEKLAEKDKEIAKLQRRPTTAPGTPAKAPTPTPNPRNANDRPAWGRGVT